MLFFFIKHDKSCPLPSTFPRVPSVHSSILICLARPLERSFFCSPTTSSKLLAKVTVPSVILELIVNPIFSSLDPSVASETATGPFMLNGHAFFFLPQKFFFFFVVSQQPLLAFLLSDFLSLLIFLCRYFNGVHGPQPSDYFSYIMSLKPVCSTGRLKKKKKRLCDSKLNPVV